MSKRGSRTIKLRSKNWATPKSMASPLNMLSHGKDIDKKKKQIEKLNQSKIIVEIRDLKEQKLQKLISVLNYYNFKESHLKGLQEKFLSLRIQSQEEILEYCMNSKNIPYSKLEGEIEDKLLSDITYKKERKRKR